jgi:hypothetical protein
MTSSGIELATFRLLAQLIFVLILHSHLCLRLTSSFCPSDFLTKIICKLRKFGKLSIRIHGIRYHLKMFLSEHRARNLLFPYPYLFHARITLLHWRWKQHIPRNHQYHANYWGGVATISCECELWHCGVRGGGCLAPCVSICLQACRWQLAYLPDFDSEACRK